MFHFHSHIFIANPPIEMRFPFFIPKLCGTHTIYSHSQIQFCQVNIALILIPPFSFFIPRSKHTISLFLVQNLQFLITLQLGTPLLQFKFQVLSYILYLSLTLYLHLYNDVLQVFLDLSNTCYYFPPKKKKKKKKHAQCIINCTFFPTFH